MLHAISILNVPSGNPAVLGELLHQADLRRRLFSNIDGYLHTSLLRSLTVPSMFLTTDFWVSKRAYDLAPASSYGFTFTHAIQSLGIAEQRFGAFAHLGRHELASNGEESDPAQKAPRGGLRS